MVQKI